MRFERKYRIEGVTLEEVLAFVRDHPLSFQTHHPDRQINNIYLDTPDLEFFRLNLIGAGERLKYRIRWYGENEQAAHQPVLEAKIKHNELGEKEIWPLSDQEELSYPTVMEWINREFPEKGPLVPILLNHYLRSYFISYDGKFRLTLDREMRFENAEAGFSHPAFLRDEAIIMEIKYDLELDKEWKRVSWHLPFRVGKNSKYVNGVLLTGHI